MTIPPAAEMTLSLAQRNPETFRINTVRTLAQEAIYGAAAWDAGVRKRTLDPAQFTVNPASWVSSSNSGSGRINLGVGHMDTAVRERVVFKPNGFTYAKEVSYKLLHEIMHGIVYAGADSNAINVLHHSAEVVRAQGLNRGLTALGSLAFYDSAYKAREDTTELMTMYAWSPEYLADYINFLEAPTMASERARVGIADVENAHVLYDMVEEAVLINL